MHIYRLNTFFSQAHQRKIRFVQSTIQGGKSPTCRLTYKNAHVLDAGWEEGWLLVYGSIGQVNKQEPVRVATQILYF